MICEYRDEQVEKKIVELPGVEPGSRESTHKLSTCLD